jgi:SAM-dependent methyltransferase
VRKDAVSVEEGRLLDVESFEDYQILKERHRVFPAIFEDRGHRKILDVAAGVGVSTQRIRDNYPASLMCSDITPKCLRILSRLEIPTVCFDIDDHAASFPFADNHFDAVVSLVTIEHLMYVDHFVQELHRILQDDGYLYIATPNYAAPEYAVRFLLSGKTFHDPLGDEDTRYEFYSHIRYFTYKTLLEFVTSFGFTPDTVYLALPGGSTRYQNLYARSKPLALGYGFARRVMFNALSPRWATEPILCFQKNGSKATHKLRKVVL